MNTTPASTASPTAWLRRATGLLLLALLLTSCATNFTPEMIRGEIVSQRGADPLGTFELNLGRFTTLLLKSAFAGENGELPFAGLGSLQLAVYEAPSDDGPVIDVTRIHVVGWDPVLRVNDPDRSGMVLIQPRGERIADLVVVGAGTRKVVYARLNGDLDPSLATAMGDVLRSGGPEEVQRVLTQLGN
jgi:hypothetical protein